jgi:NAD(P)-dependent dehydrogenase (short-subunit alcohol dehydrogenase family)
MTRISVVTGSASGIGEATKELLESRGEQVIGVDLHDADIRVDLATPTGRTTMVEEVRRLSGGAVDAVYAVAGLSLPVPATVAVNFGGALATLEGLRPLQLASPAPRAVVVSSMAALHPVDDELVDLLLHADEAAALARAEILAKDDAGARLIYSSTKLALSRWVRRNAATPDWAGASIPLNAAAPGIIATPMTHDLMTTPEATEALLQLVPMPLNGVAEPAAVAHLLAFLGSEENTHLCGQVIYVDGGSDVVMRGDGVW